MTNEERKALVEQFVKQHRAQNPFRTADVHPDDCTCLRCAVDLLDFSGQRIAELEAALHPFAFLEIKQDEGVADTQYVWETIYGDRVKDWISYDDIASARAALGETK